MTNQPIKLVPQTDSDHAEIENLLDAAFGIDRRTKTSYRLREGEKPLPGLSFVARSDDNAILGAISFWQIHIGTEGGKGGLDAVLLGPLAVFPQLQGQGIGRVLMAHAIATIEQTNHQLILLVGDEAYYTKAGFKQVPPGQIIMPGPNDPKRLLYLEITPGVLNTAHGLIRSPSRYQQALSDGTLA